MRTSPLRSKAHGAPLTLGSKSSRPRGSTKLLGRWLGPAPARFGRAIRFALAATPGPRPVREASGVAQP
eukprot:5146739-Pyramimonas_sp.AAC.1